MKGLIFNIAESYIERRYGAEFLGQLKKTDDGTLIIFHPGETYPFEDLLHLVTTLCQKTGFTVDNFLYDLGEYGFNKLALRHPKFMETHKSAKGFLLSVNDVIHQEVHNLYKEASLPTMSYQNPKEDELIITYHSEKKLYSFGAGLIAGVAEYFREKITFSSNIYTKQGEEYCDYHLIFLG